MGFEEILLSLGLGNLLDEGFVVTQIGVLVLTATFFVLSLGLCVMAARSAGSARRARKEADLALGAIRDQALEVRQLTAQAERASLRIHGDVAGAEPNAALSDRINSVRLGDTPPGSVEMPADEIELGDKDLADETAEQPRAVLNFSDAPEADVDEEDEASAENNADTPLKSAARAASEPTALLRGMLRRR